MKNKDVLDLRYYILDLNISDYVKNKILIELDEHINSLMNFYNKVLENDAETASLYMKITINKFRNNLDMYLSSNFDLTPYIEFIKENISTFNENKIRNDRMIRVYELIKNDTLNDLFFKEILIYSSRDYNTLCTDIRDLAFYLGYSEQDKPNISYSDLNVPEAIKNEIKSVE